MLSERVFEYKVVTVQPESLKDALQAGVNTSRSTGWVHIGHVRTEQKCDPVVNVFFARLVPSGTPSKPTRFYQLQHVNTIRLPNQRQFSSYEGWLPILTKRWSVFDKEVPNDYCVTFIAKPKRTTTVATIRKDVAQ